MSDPIHGPQVHGFNFHHNQGVGNDVQVQQQGGLGGHQLQVVNPPEPGLVNDLQQPPNGVPHVPLVNVQQVPTHPDERTLAREGLPTRDVLIDRIGEPPKKDIKLFGLTLKHMSTGYKDVLAKLDSYQQEVARVRNLPGNQLGEVHWRQDEQGGLVQLNTGKLAQQEDALFLLEALQQLEHSIQNYLQGGKHTHKEEMRQLLQQVQTERALVQSVLDSVNALGDKPAVDLRVAIEYRRMDPDLSLDDMQKLQDKGYTPQEYREIWAMTLEPKGITPQDARRALELGLSVDQVREFHKAHLPISESTQPRQFQDQHLESPMEPLGKGAMNEVFKATYKGVGDDPPFTGVWKREKLAESGAGEIAGIDQHQPNWSGRSVATWKLDQRLGLGLTPRTEIARHEGRLGTVQEFAPGQSPNVKGSIKMPLSPDYARYLRENPDVLDALAKERGFDGGEVDDRNRLVFRNEGEGLHTINDLEHPDHGGFVTDENGMPVRGPMGKTGLVAFDFNDGSLRREMTKLQWFDALTGQVDRHGENYFIARRDNGEFQVTSIDNDCSFGVKLTDPNMVQQEHFQQVQRERGEPAPNDTGFRGCKLPQVIDRATYEALNKLTPQQLEEDLQGLLTPQEIESTKQRLLGIQEALRSYEGEGRILDSKDDWESELTSQRLGMVGSEQFEQKVQQKRSEGHEGEQLQTDVRRLLEESTKETRSTSYVAREAFGVERSRREQQMGMEFTPVFDIGV